MKTPISLVIRFLPLSSALLIGCAARLEVKSASPGEAVATASLGGTVRVQGFIPRRRPIDTRMLGQALDRPAVLSSEEVVIDQGRLAWALVMARRAGAPQGPAPLRPAATMAFSGYRLLPRVLWVSPDQEILLTSLDHEPHAFHARTARGQVQNHHLRTGDTRTLSFSDPERPIAVQCHIHPWEKAWIAVLDGVFATVTNPAGEYALADLPAGLYEVEVWHEFYASVRTTVSLAAGQTEPADFILSEPKER